MKAFFRVVVWWPVGAVGFLLGYATRIFATGFLDGLDAAKEAGR
jgi:hypothetical protein